MKFLRAAISRWASPAGMVTVAGAGLTGLPSRDPTAPLDKSLDFAEQQRPQ